MTHLRRIVIQNVTHFHINTAKGALNPLDCLVRVDMPNAAQIKPARWICLRFCGK
jgi:hypothetical protein